MKKNLARRKSVVHSSAYDKNTCGHMVTCDHKNKTEKKNPYFIINGNVSVSNLFDEQMKTAWVAPADNAAFTVEFTKPISFYKYRFFTSFQNFKNAPGYYKISVSADGVTYKVIDEKQFDTEKMWLTSYYYATKPGVVEIPLVENVRFISVEVANPCSGGEEIALGEFDLIAPDNSSVFTPNDGYFEQYWRSAGSGEEYLILDLGKESCISEIYLEWEKEYALKYEVLASNDEKNWELLVNQEKGSGETESFTCETKARYLKLLMKETVAEHYCLKKWQVFGEEETNRETTFKHQEVSNISWRLERATDVTASGEEITLADFIAEDWLNATVPGTVLSSFMEQGAVCEYNNDNNTLQLSDNYFNSDWWYRGTFKTAKTDKNIMLTFGAVNPRADVYFNGKFLGVIEGAFTRKSFNITDYVVFGKENVIAVKVYANKHSGPQKEYYYNNNYVANGGVTGFDEPCLAAAIGWDWIPTVAGRNIGLYEDVTIEEAEALIICDPWLETVDLSDNCDTAELKFEAEIKNISANTVTAKLILKLEGKDEFVTDTIVVEGGEVLEVIMPDIKVSNPELWYPAGYGAPNMHTAEVTIVLPNGIKQIKKFDYGIRKFEYLNDENGELYILCNGKKIVCMGGNWGVPEANYRCSKERYEQMVEMHSDMNLNIIRNWVGQTRSDEFYNACDKFGVMVWNDFWLANPGDGPNPLDCDIFMQNAWDTVKRIRNHPSLLLYCGRNEGEPTEPLYSKLAKLTNELDPNRKYISHSADKEVSGFGPYCAEEKDFYFNNTPTTIHSERGVPNIPIYNSIIRFLSEKNRWPINDVWAYHGFYINGAQSADKYLNLIKKHYGEVFDLYDFANKSQMLNYYLMKAIFEADRAVDGKGMILWMSSPAIPSFVFQTYDYYLEQNGGYAGVKTANQPILAFLNPNDNSVWLDCHDGILFETFDIKAEIYNTKGEKIFSETQKAEYKNGLNQKLFVLPKFDETVFLRLYVLENGIVKSRNFDVLFGAENSKLEMEEANISINVSEDKISIKNIGNIPAVQIRFSFYADDKLSENLFYQADDNFFTLMPEEGREIEFQVSQKSAEKIYCLIDGFNMSEQIIEI